MMRLLTIEPDTSWKTADMKRDYRELAERFGVPRVVLCDWAIELREGAEVLQLLPQKENHPVLEPVRRDFKHKAANVFKSVVGSQPQYVDLQKHVGQTRCAIQQTELAHLVPPGTKPKARFKNLESMLKWAETMLRLLNNPAAQCRASLSTARMDLKNGLAARVFRGSGELGGVPARNLSGRDFIAEQVAIKGVAEQFLQLVASERKDATSREISP